MRHSTHRQAPRPVGAATAAVSKMLSRAWSLPPQRNFVAIERNVQVPMSDGTVLLADHYLPVTSQPAAAVVVVGPHDFSRTAYRNGAFDLYNFLSWSDLIVNQERVNPVTGMVRQATADRRLRPALDRAPVSAGARDLLGTGAPWFETWLEHPDLTDPFWAPLQCGAALERISVPTLLIGGWQDLFLEQTIEQFGALAERGVPSRMLIGPWTHLDAATRAGPAFIESLAWLERHAGQVPGEPATGHSVRYWVGGAREWRETATWPPLGQPPQRWYLGPDGTLSSTEPADGPPATFRYDPADPTPSVGGAILALNAGVRDNRAVEQRPDVLVFSSEPLDEPIEAVGPVTAELHVTRDNPNADLFVRLCDVDLRGRSRNVCDGIVRLTEADPLTGTVQVCMIGAAHRFGRGHRLRLQVAGGAHPRFARNPGNGQVDAPAKDFAVTHYRVQSPSALVISRAAGKEEGKGSAHA